MIFIIYIYTYIHMPHMSKVEFLSRIVEHQLAQTIRAELKLVLQSGWYSLGLAAEDFK